MFLSSAHLIKWINSYFSSPLQICSVFPSEAGILYGIKGMAAARYIMAVKVSCIIVTIILKARYQHGLILWLIFQV